MKSNEIREKFLEFFKSKGHEVIPSDSLVPKNDPTLLFTSAGMNQFKEQFLGHNVTYKRAASSQKCLRTADLDNVGKTAYHHTFFEMLGNFSFGDYFKKEAIEWGWEFITKVMGIEEKKLWVSVYKEDKESYGVWKDIIKVPKEKIVKLGAKENFWPSNAPKNGPNGPCGPCSEIFYDWGKNVGCKKKACDPSCDCGRFVEVWNLVFTEYNRKGKDKLDPLPKKNIDTGMGLERITAVIEGAKTNFDTDLFVPIINEIKKYADSLKDEDYKTIADHIRAATFSICDGVAPSNEERGYVIRKLIRRAYTRAKTGKPFLYNIVPKVVEIMKGAYPELMDKREEITLIVKEEEERFGNTLSVAIPILHESMKKTKTLKGDTIFKLVDTYGLPLEVIEEEVKRYKIKLNIKEFEKLMEKRRKLSRSKSKLADDIFTLTLFATAPKVEVSGKVPLQATVSFMVRGKKVVEEARQGDVVEVMTDPQSSSFYTEAGGQVGDTGSIENDKGSSKILNTVTLDKRIIHVVKVIKGKIKKGDKILLKLEDRRKNQIAKNHTATHLLHSALRKVLGGHVHQAGSLVDENRLRFDFTHMKKMTGREIEQVESMVNDIIEKGINLEKKEKTIEEARKEGATALFGEKYDKKVTIVKAGDFSKEVCGGTHVDNTKEIGTFRITRESSIASGVRRIEALTSSSALKWIEENDKNKKEQEQKDKQKEKEKKLTGEKLKKAQENIDTIIENAKTIKNTKVIIEEVENANMNILRRLADNIKTKTKSSFIVLASKEGNKANIILSLSKDLTSSATNAALIIKDMAKLINGSGGGRTDFAQAGGSDSSKLKTVFEFAKKTAIDIIGGIKK